MKKALISPLENNRIAQVEQVEFEVNPALVWVDCPDEVTTEWTYDGSAFNAPVIPEQVAPPEPTKEELMAKLLEIQTQLEGMQ